MCGALAAQSIILSSSLLFKSRAAYYRETASGMYHRSIYPFVNVLIEIPWLAGLTIGVSAGCLCLCVCACVLVLHC